MPTSPRTPPIIRDPTPEATVPRRVGGLMGLVAAVALAAAALRLPGGAVVVPWLGCGWLLWEATRPPPDEPAARSAGASLVRDLLQAALPYLMFAFLMLTTFLILVVLHEAGWLGPRP